jgi:negative regulator of flagellin synthesis FlgM
MEIDKIGPKALDAYVQKTQAASEKVAAAAPKPIAKAGHDEVTISNAARELQEAAKTVQNADEVRADKVAEIKKQVQEGTYNVPTDALVDKLLSVFKRG